MTHKATFYTGNCFLIKLTIHHSRVVLWAPGGGSASGYMKNQTKGLVILHYRDQCITHASGQHDMSPNARHALHISGSGRRGSWHLALVFWTHSF